MRNRKRGFGQDALNLRSKGENTLHFVIENKHLSSSRKLSNASVAQKSFRFLNDVGLHGKPFARRSLNGGNITNTRQRPMQGSRDGSRRHRETVDILADMFDAFLVFDAKTLFFIQDEQPQILKFHVLR